MKTQAYTSRIGRACRVLFSVSLFLAALIVSAPGATARQGRADGGLPTVLASGTVVSLEYLASTDLSDRDETWWDTALKEQQHLLSASDSGLRERAMQNVIFLATMYPNHADFGRTATKLYKIYRDDRNEKHRIMALSALFTVDNERVLEQVRMHLKHEGSAEVRRMTRLALAQRDDARGE